MPALSVAGALMSATLLRFHIPLIEPDVRFSRIRLSDKDSRFRTRKAASLASELNEPQFLIPVLQGISCGSPARHLVLATQPLTKPLARVEVHGAIGAANRSIREVVGPSPNHEVSRQQITKSSA